MNKLSTLIRVSTSKNILLIRSPSIFKANYLNKSTGKGDSSGSSSSSSSSTSDEEDSSTKKKHEIKLNKLNELLKSLVENDEVTKPSNLDLAKPTPRNLKLAQSEEKTKTKDFEKQMVDAVKDVAKNVGGDVKQTESELLMKLLNLNDLPGTSRNLNDIMKGMKIDRETKSTEQSRADQVRNILRQVKSTSGKSSELSARKSKKVLQSKLKQEQVVERIDLFGRESLGIFTNISELGETPETKTWENLYQRDLKLAVTNPPANYFQQMILWTEQGKLWKFPIDNEEGLEEEKKVSFEKHIFLEEHLESWCPPKGPLRHFMELVCVGLSKNHYLTVEAKIEHILWYRDYFEEKWKLLQEVGALPVKKEQPPKLSK